MVKRRSGRPPVMGKDIGVKEVSAEGTLFPTKREAAIYAEKHGKTVTKKKAGWEATNRRTK